MQSFTDNLSEQSPVVSRVNWKLEEHELSKIFPDMKAGEFAALKRSILRIGLQDAIVLYDGKILDGRQRYGACIEIGVEPEFIEFKGTLEQARAFVVSMNLMRTELSISQRAITIALRYLPVIDIATERSRRLPRHRRITVRLICEDYGMKQITMYKAFWICRKSPEHAQAIFRGELSITRAEDAIRSAL